MRPRPTTLLTTVAVCAAARAAAFAQPAPAQPPLPPPPPTDAPPTDAPTATPVSTGSSQLDDLDTLGDASWHDARVPSGVGISTSLGGGVLGFTDKTMRSVTSNVGGLWDLRVTFGTRLPIAVEVSYVGSATGLNGFAERGGTLLGTTVEGAARWNLLPRARVTPYLFGGVGWTRYVVTKDNVTFADAGMSSSDDLLEVPAGLGVTWRASGLTADVRGTYRWTEDQNLVLKNPLGAVTTNHDDFAPMHSWEASAALGYEF